jgi:hypothetical protein
MLIYIFEISYKGPDGNRKKLKSFRFKFTDSGVRKALSITPGGNMLRRETRL